MGDGSAERSWELGLEWREEPQRSAKEKKMLVDCDAKDRPKSWRGRVCKLNQRLKLV